MIQTCVILSALGACLSPSVNAWHPAKQVTTDGMIREALNNVYDVCLMKMNASQIEEAKAFICDDDDDAAQATYYLYKCMESAAGALLDDLPAVKEYNALGDISDRICPRTWSWWLKNYPRRPLAVLDGLLKAARILARFHVCINRCTETIYNFVCHSETSPSVECVRQIARAEFGINWRANSTESEKARGALDTVLCGNSSIINFESKPFASMEVWQAEKYVGKLAMLMIIGGAASVGICLHNIPAISAVIGFTTATVLAK